MPLNFFGKLLFPRQQAWQQRRQVKAILLALLVGLTVAALVAAAMFLRNSAH